MSSGETAAKATNGPQVEQVTAGPHIRGGVYGNANGVGFHDAHGRPVDEEGNLMDADAVAKQQRQAEKEFAKAQEDQRAQAALDAQNRAEQERAIARANAEAAAERARLADEEAKAAAKATKAVTK